MDTKEIEYAANEAVFGLQLEKSRQLSLLSAMLKLMLTLLAKYLLRR